MILYHFSASPPSRFALLTARELDIDLEISDVNLFKQEQLSEEFIKINPLHQVPVLVDGDFKITDSRAIACFLANLHPESSLYPTDPKKRAKVDQILYMDATYIFPTWYNNALSSVLRQVTTKLAPEAREKINVMMQNLENILIDSQYFSGDDITLADLSIVCSIGVLFHTGMSFEKFPKVQAWYESLKALKGWNETDSGAEAFGIILKNLLAEPL